MANFTIKEGGQARAFTAKRLQTPLAGGGVEQWVPEDDHRLGTLYATKDGDYKAADEGYYAYSEVTASVPSSGHVTGKGPDGNTYDYTVDADGYLTETKVPSEIRITTPPTFTGPYAPGENIQYSGLVVTAYDADGQSMGEVPFSELIFPQTTINDLDIDEWTNGAGVNAASIQYSQTTSITEWVEVFPGRVDEDTVYVDTTALGTREGHAVSLGGFNGPALILATRYNGKVYALRVRGDDTWDLMQYWNHELDDSGQTIRTGWFLRGGTSDSTVTDAFKYMVWSEYITNLPESTVDPSRVGIGDMRATLTVPVQWPRTGDGMLLETGFDVIVEYGAGD